MTDLTCLCSDAVDFFYDDPAEPAPVDAQCACVSCKARIAPGDMASRVEIMEYQEGGERVPGDALFLCEDCWGLYDRIVNEMGFCWYTGDNLKELAREVAKRERGEI